MSATRRENLSPMDPHDALFKLLLTTFFLQFVRRSLPEVAEYLDPASIVFLDKEVITLLGSGERHTVDILVRAKFRGSDMFFLIHVENQSRPEGDFPRRVFFYFADLHAKYLLPVYPVAVFSYDRPNRPEGDRYQVDFPDRTVLDFRFRVIQLNRLDWRDFADEPNPVSAALMTRMRIAPKDRPLVKLACVRMMLRLPLNPAERALVSKFVDTYLRLEKSEKAGFVKEVRKLDPPEQEKVMDVLNEWVEEGIQRGLEQGIQRGLEQGLEAERSLVLKLLRRKVGRVPARTQARVRALSAARLEDLAEALLAFSTAADLSAWLVAHG